VGWQLSDVPSFAPPPPPEPVVLPPGGEALFLSRVPVTQPVAFLTIDDGYLKPGEAPKLFAAAHIPVTLFLTTDAIKNDVPFFDHLRAYGAVIEAHTISHPELRGRPEAFQRHEICDGADRLGQWYGRRPVLFRPPFWRQGPNDVAGRPRLRAQGGILLEGDRRQGQGPLPGGQHRQARRHHPDALPPGLRQRLPRRPASHPPSRPNPGPPRELHPIRTAGLICRFDSPA
jgi:peptidoglycan/xylan/chitin deacetylase (PgdA/CDA1 family)